ncbi:O-Antigen ligase [Lachnospiraceae bacterium NLAE-zl-G231]|nr:O-Antigen ligase [Lachnospiraceae bacterium NLAE-zl-G231]
MKIKTNNLIYGLMVVYLSIYSFTRGGIGLILSQSTWAIGLLFIMILSALGILSKGIKKVYRTDVPVLFMLMEIVLWKNWDFTNGIWFLDFIIVVFLLFLIVANKTDCWFDIAIKMVLLMGVFHAFWTIVCYLSSDIYYMVVYPIVNNIAQWNLTSMYEKGFMTGFNYTNSQNAIYLTSGLIVCVCLLFFNGNKKIINSKTVLLLVVMAICLLLTGKRGPIVWFAMAFIIVYWLYNCDKPTNRTFKIAAIIVFVIAAIYITSFIIPGVLNFVYRFIEMSEQGDITTHRTKLWAMGWKAFLDSPIWGNGWFWFKYHNSYGTTYHVHNCYIQWLCELGIIGALPWFWFVVINIVHTVKMVIGIKKEKILDFNGNVLRHLAFSALYQFYFLIFAFAATSFYEPECLLPYIFSCGISMYYWRSYKMQGIMWTRRKLS